MGCRYGFLFIATLLFYDVFPVVLDIDATLQDGSQAAALQVVRLPCLLRLSRNIPDASGGVVAEDEGHAGTRRGNDVGCGL